MRACAMCRSRKFRGLSPCHGGLHRQRSVSPSETVSGSRHRAYINNACIANDISVVSVHRSRPGPAGWDAPPFCLAGHPRAACAGRVLSKTSASRNVGKASLVDTEESGESDRNEAPTAFPKRSAGLSSQRLSPTSSGNRSLSHLATSYAYRLMAKRVESLADSTSDILTISGQLDPYSALR
jgi:hypothetical protein